MDLNTREIAFLIWAGIILVALCVWKTTRMLMPPLLKFVLNWRFVAPFALASLWSVACIYVLYLARIWTPDHTKTSIVWLVTFGFVTIFDIAQASHKSKKLTPLFWEGFSATAIVLYLAEFETMPLWVELVILPIGVLISVMADHKSREPIVQAFSRFMKGLQILVGSVIFAFGIYGVMKDFSTFASLDTLRDFGVPVLLTGIFLPFLYVLLLYITFENASRRIAYIEKDKRLRQYAIFRGIWVFRGDLEYFYRFVRDLGVHEGTGRLRIDETMAQTRQIHKRDQAPPLIFSDEGWSPQEVGGYLEDYDIIAGDYHPSYDDMWWATSNYKKLGNSTLNTLSLRIYGNARVVTRMKLSMVIWDRDEIAVLEEVFAKMSQLLIAMAADPEMARRFTEASVGLEMFNWNHNGLSVSIETEDNPVTLRRCLRIQHPKDGKPSDF